MMMQGFDGFPQKARLIQIPGTFFSELLPQIDHLAELKVTLYCFWRLQQQEGRRTAFLRRRDVLSDQVFMSGLAPRADEREARLQEGLERAVNRGTLLHAHSVNDNRADDFYFVNTPRGRAAVRSIEQGQWSPGSGDSVPFDLSVERPNIFTLYEQNIGPLTPLIADSLRDLEQTYPAHWIEDALAIAVENNVRRLKYIEAILQRWQTDGRVEQPGADTDDSQPYISGKYRDDIEY